MKDQIRSLFVAPLILFFWFGLLGNPVDTEHVELELVAEKTALVPGETLTVAVRMKMDEHWHTYWANPGETGLPTQIEWSLPEGITAGPIQWPAPQWINYFDMVSYAYEGEVLLLVDLRVAETFKSDTPVALEARVDFLVCKEACIPGGADLTLSLPVKVSAEFSSRAEDIDATRARLPRILPGWEMKVVDNAESFALTVVAPEGSSFEGREATYFSLDGWVAPSEPRTSVAEGRLLNILLPKTDYPPEDQKDRFRGVLTSDIPWQANPSTIALEVNLPFSEDEEVANWLNNIPGLADTGLGGGESRPVTAGDTSFVAAIGLAFLGGILLNLMPCVFPVLSIKVLGFVQQAGEDQSKVKIHGFVFMLGVLVSFWLLAGLFLILRAAGQEIGWGFQLQTPGFVAVLISVLFLFGLNLSGVFEIGESLVGAGGGLQTKSGYSGSFFSGVLATVVATPCTAPFMGTALGVIVTLSAVQSMAVFTSLALGVALPYVLLSLFPAFLKWLPRPGAWMESFKKALAFLLYATVVWLAWVFGSQVGVNGMAALLLGLVALGIAAWIWGNWGNLTRRKPVRRAAALTALLFLITGGVVQYVAAGFEPVEVRNTSETTEGISWKPYSPEAVSASLEAGKTVYVDFTATWCLTCQVNKRVALSNDKVVRYFQDESIVALKGDWTRRDPVITRELEKFGRSGVPTNVIYRADGSTRLLPEVLTPGIVLDALKEKES